MKTPVAQLRSILFALITLSSMVLAMSQPVQRTFSAPISKPTPETIKERALDSYANLPLRFELNQGQTDGSVKFLSRAKGYTLFMTPNEATLALQGQSAGKNTEAGLLRMKFVEGELYIVMELVEGKSLRALIGNTGLPAELVLRYGVQIASALARAHDKGIVHRDLKSANIVVTEDGLVKVLDFGR